MASPPYIDLPFGQYLPDLGGVPIPERAAYLTDAINVRYTPSGYRGMPTFEDVTSPSAINGAPFTTTHGAAFRSSSGTLHFFAVRPGASAQLYESRDEGDSAWENITPAAGTGPTENGDFARFGDDVIYICHTRAAIVKAMGDPLATDFSDLAGSPPIARCGAVVGQHVVLGALSTDPYAIRTSAIGNHEDWPTPGTADARSKEAITESLDPQFGEVARVLGGEKIGIVAQRYGLTRMTYVGGSTVFSFDVFERTLGMGSPFSAYPATDGKLWYFSNESGVFVTDGYSVQSLSKGKIDDALYQNLISHTDGSTPKQQYESVFDARLGLVIFGMDSQYAVKSLVFDVATNSFSLFNDTDRTALFAAIRNQGASITDSGRHVYTIGASSGFLRRLTGSAGTIALQTGYIELDPGFRVQLQGAQLLGPGTSGLTVAYKAAATASACDVSQSGFTSMTAAPLGEMKTARASSRYFAFRITGTGAESQLIQGIRVFFRRADPAR